MASSIATSLPVKENQDKECDNILHMLTNDCLTHVLSYVPLRDVILSERVSKGWQAMVNKYFDDYRTFDMSYWQGSHLTKFPAEVLTKILQKLGPSLRRLFIDNRWAALDDQIAHTVGRFCPNLEKLAIAAMETDNWNSLEGCERLKMITFVWCSKLKDSHLTHLFKRMSHLEQLVVAYNLHVTGLFLTEANLSKLTSISFYHCVFIQGTILDAAMNTLSNLTILRLDGGTGSLIKMIPSILKKLPKLERLSLNKYWKGFFEAEKVDDIIYEAITDDKELFSPNEEQDFFESLASLKELKYLTVYQNEYITDDVLKAVAQSCQKLEYLNVSSCNPRTKSIQGVSDVGISAVCSGCPLLWFLDVSYLRRLTKEGVAAVAQCSQLTTLIARGYEMLLAQPFAQCVARCHNLKAMDLSGCDRVTDELVYRAVAALEEKPRRLVLRLAGTAVTQEEDLPTHRLLTVNITDNLCDPEQKYDLEDDSSDSE